MKKLVLSLATFAILVLAFAPAFVSCSSTTTTVQGVAYTSLATIGNAVNAAEQGYMDLIVKGTISTNSLASEAKAYNQFQGDFGIAVSLVSGSTTNAAPPSLLAEGNAFVSSIAALSTSTNK